MNRAMLAIGAAVVLAAGVILWLMLRDDNRATPSTPSTTTQQTPEPVVRPPAADRIPAPNTPVVTDSDEPRSAQAEAEQPREYTVGGIEVRDHRTGNHPPMDLPLNIHPPTTHRVAAALVHELSSKIQGVMKECTANLPPEARGTKPRLEGVVWIAIKDKQARVTEATMQLRDVVGDAVEPTKTCIQEKSVGITTPAANEPDLEKYSISVTYALL
jgi:hypothetical protein